MHLVYLVITEECESEVKTKCEHAATDRLRWLTGHRGDVKLQGHFMKF